MVSLLCALLERVVKLCLRAVCDPAYCGRTTACFYLDSSCSLLAATHKNAKVSQRRSRARQHLYGAVYNRVVAVVSAELSVAEVLASTDLKREIYAGNRRIGLLGKKSVRFMLRSSSRSKTPLLLCRCSIHNV